MSKHVPYVIRRATERDVHQLWQLMREFAAFEQHADRFGLTEEAVRMQGFRKEHPDFYAVVAENVCMKTLGAAAVYCFIPFNLEGKPTLFVKIFYVAEALRRKGIGKKLMEALRAEAKSARCGKIEGKFASWNQSAVRFCKQQGAHIENGQVMFEIRM